MIGQGRSDWGTTYNNGNTGGEVNHTLTTNEIPAHNHTGSANTSGSGGVPRFSDGDIWSANKTKTLSAAGSHTHNVTINNAGGGQPHNNMQPYLVVHMWKRTA